MLSTLNNTEKRKRKRSGVNEPLEWMSRCGIQDLCKGGPSRDFADIAQRSRGGSKNLGPKMGGRGGGGARAPPRSAPDEASEGNPRIRPSPAQRLYSGFFPSRFIYWTMRWRTPQSQLYYRPGASGGGGGGQNHPGSSKMGKMGKF